MAGKELNDQSVFEVARKIDVPEVRHAYLRQVCGEDPAMMQRILALLEAHQQERSFLESPPPGVQQSPTVQDVPTEQPGTRIGPYKLLQQIGEGGMGVVWMAEQHEPVRRKIALKVIKPGMDSQSVIARFEAERQALSLMDHPNIAKVLDAGTTETGRPYFVMELVKGQPITQYCNERRLSTRQRLEMLIGVCQAIQHAHQKGIIHRDIKPSNVLIAEYDHQSVPKVIDFGVAKAISQPLTERTMFTGFGQLVGTIEYMSPEQAKVNQLDVDTRSDIYSLGVLLYELLTDSTPFDRQRLRSAAWDEMLRIIREEEPPRPSTRLSSSPDSLPSISAERQTEPERLTRLVRGELDWIAMKALEKDRNRRYETANDFAQDLQRYLVDEPVRACPPSAWYRFRKFVRRNKQAAFAALFVFLALIAVVIGTTWSLIREQQHSQELRAAHERERHLNERARQAIEAVMSETALDQLTRQQQLRPEQKDFLDKMLKYYAESTQDATATEEERSRQERAYFRMGVLNQTLGRSRDSENAYRQAIALGHQLTTEFPNQPEFRKRLALSHSNLGIVLGRTGRRPEAEAAYSQALVGFKLLVVDFPKEQSFRQALAGTYNNLGNLLHVDGRMEKAEPAYLESLAIRKQLAVEFPEDIVLQRALAMSHNCLGWLWQNTQKREKAELSYREAVIAQKQAVATYPHRPEFRAELAKYQVNLGNVLRDEGRLDEAEAVYSEALPIAKQVVTDFPSRPEFRDDLASCLSNLGLLLQIRGQLQEAEKNYGESLAIYKQLVADFDAVPDYHNGTAGALFNLAQAASGRRDFITARKLLEEGLPYHKVALQADSGNSTYRQSYWNTLVELSLNSAGLMDRTTAVDAALKRRNVGWEPPTDAYAAAWMLARCVSLLEKDEQLDAMKRQAEMQFYADQATGMLRDALAKGYKDIRHINENKDLDPLREREDFKKLIADLATAVTKN